MVTFQPTKLYNAPLPINYDTKEDLLRVCEKNQIPPNHHQFFKSLIAKPAPNPKKTSKNSSAAVAFALEEASEGQSVTPAPLKKAGRQMKKKPSAGTWRFCAEFNTELLIFSVCR